MGNSNPRLFDLVEAKRSVDALPAVVWTAALGLGRLRRPRLGLLLVLGFALASFRLTTSSATIAMVFSLGIFGLATWSPAAARRLLAGGTVAAFLLAIPLAILTYDAGGATAPFLKFSARHRVEIWHFAAEKSLDRPLFGHGFNSSRYVPNDGAVSAFQAPGKPVITLHPHDAFLQIWLELGLVGVTIVAAGALALALATRAWPSSAARFGLAAYAAAIVVAALAFGIWQTWWMATLGFGVAVCAILNGQPSASERS